MIHNFSWVIPSQLAGSSIPGGYLPGPVAVRRVRADLRDLYDRGIRLLVSLTRSASSFGPACREVGFSWLYFPIPEFGVPADRNSFHTMITEVLEAMKAGRPVCVHCYAGVGRTGLVLACLLGRTLALNGEQAIRRIREVRSALETEEQERFVHQYLSALLDASGPFRYI